MNAALLPSADAPIGVFDSGVGGLSVLRALRERLPAEHFVYFADSGHAPYGEKGDAFVLARSEHIVQQLRDTHRIKALVIACNTATAAAGHVLRQAHPDLPIVGVEPALKPAVLRTRTARVGVLATRGTVTSAKFATLQASLAGQAEFIVQPCDGLASAIERQDHAAIATLCEQHTAALGAFGTQAGQIDTLVLGCTHYPFVSDVIARCVGAAVTLLETGEPVARHTAQLLGTRGVPLRRGERGNLTLLTSGHVDDLTAAAQRWLHTHSAAETASPV